MLLQNASFTIFIWKGMYGNKIIFKSDCKHGLLSVAIRLFLECHSVGILVLKVAIYNHQPVSFAI